MQHRARRRFGQNFLVDTGVINDIIGVIGPQPSQLIAEIGPGQGALTQYLVKHCKLLTALEIDRDLISHLEAQFATFSNFEVINADALHFNFADLANNQDIRIVGNLPYNISTSLLLHLTSFCHSIADMHFMLQKEVVQRISATPDTKHWGRLSVILQYHYTTDYLFDVEPSAFKPKPKVDSAIIRLVPKKPATKVKSLEIFESIIKQSFAKRRKTIRNNLKWSFNDSQFEQLDINPNNRPEQLTLAQFVAMANALVDRE